MGKREKHVICDECGYHNHPYFVKESGICHCCKKILDEKVYFKWQMKKKLRLWQGKREDGCNWWNMQ